MAGVSRTGPPNKVGPPPHATPLVLSSAFVPPALVAALDYQARAWSVLALCDPQHRDPLPDGHRHSDDRRGKVPCEGWKQFQTRPATVKELIALWTKYPNANVGVATGPVSGLGMFDIDDEWGWERLCELLRGTPPPTVEFTTPRGGRRLLYRFPHGWHMRSRSWQTRGHPLDFLGEHKQSAMPGSVNKDGVPYAWVEGRGPDQVAIAESTDRMRYVITCVTDKEREPGGGAQRVGRVYSGRASPLHQARRICETWRPAIDGQGGHPQTYAVACALARVAGLSKDDALAIFKEVYNPRCQGPWEDNDLQHKIDDAFACGGVSTPRSQQRTKYNGHEVRPIGEAVDQVVDQVERKRQVLDQARPGLRVVREDNPHVEQLDQVEDRDPPADQDDEPADQVEPADEPEPLQNGRSLNIAQCNTVGLTEEQDERQATPQGGEEGTARNNGQATSTNGTRVPQEEGRTKVPHKTGKRTKKVDSVDSDNGVSYTTKNTTSEGGEGESDKPLSPDKGAAAADQVEPKKRPGVLVANLPDEKHTFLWRPWLVHGEATLLTGPGSAGKSSFCAAAMKHARHTLHFGSTDENVKLTMRQRLLAAGVNPSTVTTDLGGEWEVVTRRDDIIAWMLEIGADLLVFDPLKDYLGPGNSEGWNDVVKEALRCATFIATKTGAAVLCTAHPGRNLKGVVRGASAWEDKPRVLLKMDVDKGQTTTRILSAWKYHVGDCPQAIYYDIVRCDEGGVRWEPGEPVAPDVLESLTEDGDQKGQLQLAMDILRRALANGPMDHNKVYALGKKDEISASTMRKARLRLGYPAPIPQGQGGDLKYIWRAE